MTPAAYSNSDATPLGCDDPTGRIGAHPAHDRADIEPDSGLAAGVLTDIVRMLPASITVQDEHGNFLLVNDAAAAQLNLPASDFPSLPTHDADGDRAINVATTRSGSAGVIEETIAGALGQRVFLTTHKPVRIANRPLLLTSSVDVTEQKSLENKLYRLAYFDELTGLPTRRLVEDRANSLLRHDEPAEHFALAFFDIDNFKHINDYYGHSVGDALLIAFAQRIGFYLRESDILGRMSGDEFLLLLNPIRSEAEVAEYFQGLLQKLKAPYILDGSEVFASTSIGVSLYPAHGRGYDALLQNADIAMYRVKNSVKGGFAFFDSGMESEALERIQTEQSLRLAIQDRQFCCAFQPKVDIRTHEVKGVEALVRLRNEHGVIQAPGTFVDLAVELGLIDRLTYLVLDEIMMSIDLIDAAFGANVSISINVAAKQAGNPEFMRSFAEALAATGCPERFVIEVTEDAFVAKTHFQEEILPLLRALGVGISIDDFGIGYSSLSALADITADEIKIDRSFITDIHKRPRNQSILRAIESLSEALGMVVIAEGVETFEELAYLQAATKIRYAQGFYFSKPIFLDDIRSGDRTAMDAIRGNTGGRQLEPARQAAGRSAGRGR